MTGLSPELTVRKLKCKSSQHKGVLEFGEFLHLFAAFSSQVPTRCQEFVVKFEFDGFYDWRTQVVATLGEISEQTKVNLSVDGQGKGFVPPRDSTGEIDNSDGHAADRIRCVLSAISQGDIHVAEQRLAGIAADHHSAMAVWIRTESPADSRKRDLTSAALEEILNAIPTGVARIVFGAVAKDEALLKRHAKIVEACGAIDLRGIYLEPEFNGDRRFQRQIAFYRHAIERLRIVGCIGMQCGGMDVLEFLGLRVACVSTLKDNKVRARMQVIADVFPHFQNITIDPAFDANDDSLKLPQCAMDQIAAFLRG